MKEQFRVWITFENDHRILDTDWSTTEHVERKTSRTRVHRTRRQYII